MDTTRVFKELCAGYTSGYRYLDSCGGTRSGKTYSALQFLTLLAMTDPKPTLTSIVSENGPHLRRGAIRDFKMMMVNEGLWKEQNWSAGNLTYTFPSGSQIEFFGLDSLSKVHGPARDRLFINEAQNTKFEVARQLFVRTRGLIVIDYNPTHSFWVHERIKPSDRCYTIVSTYKDNRFLSPEQVEEIESYKNDEKWWRVYGMGLTGQIEGVIYDFEQIDEMPDPVGLVEVYGLDFGYTNDPTALVRVLADTKRKILYVDEEIYQTHLLNKDIVALMRERGIPRSVEIFGDSSEPKSIDEIAYAGYNCKPCYKGRTIIEQIQFLKGWTIKVTKRSVNVTKEMRNYTWSKDKNDRQLNLPIDLWNHAMDAMRYAVYTKFGTFKKPITGGTPRRGTLW